MYRSYIWWRGSENQVAASDNEACVALNVFAHQPLLGQNQSRVHSVSLGVLIHMLPLSDSRCHFRGYDELKRVGAMPIVYFSRV